MSAKAMPATVYVAVRRHRWARALLIHAASHVNLTMKKRVA